MSTPNFRHTTTAGRITIFTALFGVAVFAFVFLLDLGAGHVAHVAAQDVATTTVTVLNTPPQWTVDAQESVESSTTTPTNSGDVVVWTATGTDSNAADYYLLICSTNATPTANPGAPPACVGGTQWGVSGAVTSGTQALVSTTTTEAMAESNDWYASICDGDLTTPRCNTDIQQGSGSTASPFSVNHRPTFTVFVDDSPTLPGVVVTFTSTSSDTDSDGAQDTVQLIVCNANDYATSTNQCGGGGTLATSTFAVSDPSATYTVVIPTQDQTYSAYGHIVDNHGHEATGGSQATDSVFVVSNATPTVGALTIDINGGTDISLTVEEGETTGFTFDYTVTDNNSCQNASAGDEIVDYVVHLYRSGVGSTTCNNAGAYDANNCYSSEVSTTTWNFTCTASSTSCTGASDVDMVYECTFPLWYIAEATDAGSPDAAENWLATAAAVDDDSATSTATEAGTGVELNSLLAFDLNTFSIPYGSLEPGQQSDPITATTTVEATGNVGIDENLIGESMCTNYQTGTDCANSSTSTIPASEQVYATSSVSYASGTALSSTTPTEVEINVPKTTATATPASGDTLWGIRIPAAITLSGTYTGENTFTAVTSEPGEW